MRIGSVPVAVIRPKTGNNELNITCPTITPTYGADTLLNGGFEGTYDDESGGTGTCNVAPNWTHDGIVHGTDVLDKELAIVHGGLASQKLVANAAARGVTCDVGQGVTASGWWYLGGSVYRVGGTGTPGITDGASTLKVYGTSTNAWLTGHTTDWMANAQLIYCKFIAGSGWPLTAYFDDASCKPITFASMITLLGTRTQKDGTYICHPTVASGTQCGMLICYASATNFVLAYVNRNDNKAYLKSVINGTYATKASGAMPTGYGAGKELKVVATAGTYKLYYDGQQIGTDQVISETTLGLAVYGFNSESGNTVGVVTTSPFDLSSPSIVTVNDPNTATATRATSPLTTPTYDGSGQAVHPSVYDAGSGSTWNGHRYWMAMTPYPGGNSAYEKPSILVSEDNITWSVPVGLTNPIVASGSLADADLILDSAGTTMWCVYRSNSGAAIMATSSTDGITWTTPIVLFADGGVEFAVSPSAVWNGAQYQIYYIDYAAVKPYTMKRRTCATMNGAWSASATLATTLPPGVEYRWHLDVIYDAVLSAYWCLLNANGSSLYLGISEDGGANWNIARTPIIATGGWDAVDYRASILRTATGFAMWYSANNAGTPQVWHIGYTPIAWAP